MSTRRRNGNSIVYSDCVFARIGMLLVGWDGHCAGCNEYMIYLNKGSPGASKF